MQGDPVDLDELRGEVVVLNVWGSWCNPCRKEAPLLVEAAEQLGDQAAFVGLFARSNDLDAALAFEREYGITYPTVDDDGESLLELGRYAPPAVPSTIILDADRPGGRADLGRGPVDHHPRRPRRGDRGRGHVMGDWFEGQAATGSLALALPVAAIAGWSRSSARA